MPSGSSVPARRLTFPCFDTPCPSRVTTVYPRIYRAVREIPYGSTVNLRRDCAGSRAPIPAWSGRPWPVIPTPLVIPCHRVVAADGIGGFSPSVEIKEELLAMEKKGLRKLQLEKKANH